MACAGIVRVVNGALQPLGERQADEHSRGPVARLVGKERPLLPLGEPGDQFISLRGGAGAVNPFDDDEAAPGAPCLRADLVHDSRLSRGRRAPVWIAADPARALAAGACAGPVTGR